MSKTAKQNGVSVPTMTIENGRRYLRLRDDPVANTREIALGVYADYTSDGRLIGLEILGPYVEVKSNSDGVVVTEELDDGRSES